jgi:dTDP-glucose 4,6-dehydratase
LVEHLVRDGYSVRALALYNSFGARGWIDALPAEVVAEVEILSGDVRDSHFIGNAMRGSDAVLHLAALIAIPYSYAAPESYVQTNVIGTLNVLQAARANDVSRVLVTSTSEVYGTAQTVPISESHPLSAQSPYAATKIAADQLALSYAATYRTPVTIVRPFNTYGPRQSARAVIPTVITQLAAGRTSIELGSTRPTRDFMFVKDTAAAFAATLQCTAAIGEVLNFGTGYEVSVGETVRLIAEIMGVEVEVRSVDERIRPDASEVERLVADPSKAMTMTGWRPTLSGREGLTAGLRETVDWFSEPGNLARYRVGEYVV